MMRIWMQQSVNLCKCTTTGFIREGKQNWILLLNVLKMRKNSEEELSCAHKLLNLDPYHFKARIIVEISKCNSPLLAFSTELSEEQERLQAKGYDIGKYYEIPERRDFIKGLSDFMDSLVGFKYYNAAVRIGESFMDYYTNDNTGSRYYLMHLYAMLGEDAKANA